MSPMPCTGCCEQDAFYYSSENHYVYARVPCYFERHCAPFAGCVPCSKASLGPRSLLLTLRALGTLLNLCVANVTTQKPAQNMCFPGKLALLQCVTTGATSQVTEVPGSSCRSTVCLVPWLRSWCSSTAAPQRRLSGRTPIPASPIPQYPPLSGKHHLVLLQCRILHSW